MKSKVFRVRLEQDDAEYLERIARESGLLFIEVAKMILHAGIRSMREAPEIRFPVRFEVSAAPGIPIPARTPALNDPKTRYTRH